MLLGSPVSEQFEQIVRGGDQMPHAVDFFKAPQLEVPQTPGFLDLTVHRLHDRFALGVDPGSFLASELADHAGSGIGISW